MGPYNDFHTAYVLKGLTDPQGEILNLHFVKSSDLFTRMKGFADAFPYITMHEFAAGYAVHGKRYYFVMLEAARGKSLLELTRDAARALKANDMDARAVAYLESLETIKTAYNRLGFKMANLHMSYMEPKGAIFGETVVHGDLHHENVFYDKKTNTVSLIDNESFAPSLLGKLASPGQDIVRIYFFGAAILDTSLRFAKEIADDVWAQVTLKPFLEGYVSAYPLGRRKELKAELLKILATPNALQILLKYSAGKPQVYDPIRVALFQSRYVMPIINAL